MSNRHERPICRRCKSTMQVSHVEPEGERELWVFRCEDCGQETSVLLEPFATPRLATAIVASELHLI